MCLDPRPDSLVRARRSAAQASLTTAGRVTSASADAQPLRRLPAGPQDAWLQVFADDLDARGWTLVARTVAAC